LMPYIYSEAIACGQTSLPMVRHLVLEWQEDPIVPFIEDEYLFGRAILVAPILDEGDRRRLYLPPGEWFDFWTKQKLPGGSWVEVEAPLEVLPLYVRAGAIVPYAPLMQHTEEAPWDPLTVEVYGAQREAEYALYTDVHSAPQRVRYWREGEHLFVQLDTVAKTVELALFGVEVLEAAVEQHPLPCSGDARSGYRMTLSGRALARLRLA
ncbi:MAG: glycoside hydrolase family 31 protein, partial [Anaerolineae bacterium]|nr:glycoside hydrolase family 31 protein [Anaerolineae bacterium]